jgi:uncharacterized protein (DUF1697 family)
MPTFVALLRGVNVGKAKRVRMAVLRALLSGLGYTGVSTLLNSGNVVFRSTKRAPAKHAARIAAAISDNMQVEVPVIVKSAKELAAIVAENPITADTHEHSRFIVAFVQDTKVLPSLLAIQSLVAPSEQFAVGKSAAYLFCSQNLLESKAGQAILDTAGRLATTRNWATVLKLQALVVKTDASAAQPLDCPGRDRR